MQLPKFAVLSFFTCFWNGNGTISAIWVVLVVYLNQLCYWMAPLMVSLELRNTRIANMTKKAINSLCSKFLHNNISNDQGKQTYDETLAVRKMNQAWSNWEYCYQFTELAHAKWVYPKSLCVCVCVHISQEKGEF